MPPVEFALMPANEKANEEAEEAALCASLLGSCICACQLIVAFVRPRELASVVYYKS